MESHQDMTAPDPSLRYVDLNRWINADYGRLGERFQAIVDPSFGSTGVSDVYPTWFAFAAFASRGIGKAQLGAAIGLDAARRYRETGDHRAALAQSASPDVAELAARLIGGFIHEEARLAATFLVAFASALGHHGAFDGLAASAMFDPRTLTVSVERLLEIMRKAASSNPIERLASVALTLRNTMEDGNRRIYTDIGGAAHAYLDFRAGRAGQATPEVLSDFSLPGLSRPDQAKAAYDFAILHVRDTPLPIDFDKLLPDLTHDARPLLIAAFALYELAGTTQDPAAKNRYVAFANNFVIFREQHQAVQRAFTPGTVLPGEVERLKLLAIITPAIQVALRAETWMFWQYADKHLPSRGFDLLRSRATEYNWGVFADRWAPVIDTYGPCYRNPRVMWPVPNPDPNEGF